MSPSPAPLWFTNLVQWPESRLAVWKSAREHYIQMLQLHVWRIWFSKSIHILKAPQWFLYTVALENTGQENNIQTPSCRVWNPAYSGFLQFLPPHLLPLLHPLLHSANMSFEASQSLYMLCLVPRRYFPQGVVWWKPLCFSELSLTLPLTNITGALSLSPTAPCIHLQSLNPCLSDVLKPGTQAYSF